MTHAEKIEYLRNDPRLRGISQLTTAPLFHRTLWRLGWEMRPPLFQSFIALFLVSAIMFAIGYGLILWLLVWRTAQVAAHIVFVNITGTGIFFGLGMAIYFRWKARMLNLPDWEKYPD